MFSLTTRKEKPNKRQADGKQDGHKTQHRQLQETPLFCDQKLSLQNHEHKTTYLVYNAYFCCFL